MKHKHNIRITQSTFASLLLIGFALEALLVPAVSSAKVLVIKWKESPFYNAAIAGFREASRLDLDIINCQGNREAVKSAIDKSGTAEMILLVGEAPLKEAVKAGMPKPAVYCMVYNPETIIGTADNITGVSLNIPYSQQMTAIKRMLPAVKRIGVLYAQKAFVDGLTEAAATEGVSVVEAKIADGSVKESLTQLKKTDLILITLDPSLVTQEAMSSVLLFGLENKIPVYAPTDKFVKAGAVLGLMADYAENGREAGRLASQIKKDGNLPLAKAMDRGNLFINLKTARDLGITLAPDVIKNATEAFDK